MEHIDQVSDDRQANKIDMRSFFEGNEAISLEELTRTLESIIKTMIEGNHSLAPV